MAKHITEEMGSLQLQSIYNALNALNDVLGALLDDPDKLKAFKPTMPTVTPDDTKAQQYCDELVENAVVDLTTLFKKTVEERIAIVEAEFLKAKARENNQVDIDLVPFKVEG